MNMLPLLNQSVPETFIPVETLVDHVYMRADMIDIQLHDFTQSAVVNWLSEFSNHYIIPSMLISGKNISELGCRTIISTLQELSLQAVLHSDVTVLFHGYAAANMILRSTLPQVGLVKKFEPDNTKPFYFPNTARGISTVYLTELIGGVVITPEDLESMCAYVDEDVETVTTYTEFYGYMPADYFLEDGTVAKHSWVSPALALLIVSQYGPNHQVRLLDDLSQDNPF